MVRSLVLRTLRSRYRQTLLGVTWTVIQSVSGALLVGVLLGNVVDVGGRESYLETVLVGMLIWTFYSRVVNSALTSLLDEHLFIASAWFPRDTIPVSRLLVGLVDLAVGAVFVGVALVLAGHTPTICWAALPLAAVVLTAFTLACCLAPAALNLIYRDVGHGLPTVLQLGFFASPVLFPSSVVGGKWQEIYSAVNPVAATIDAARAIVLADTWPQWSVLGAAGVWSLVLLAASWSVFLRVEATAADRL